MFEEDYEEDVQDLLDYDFEYDDEDDGDYNFDDIDDMLDAMMEEADEDDEFAERRRRRRRRPNRQRPRRTVPVARGRSAYRTPARGRYVTQKQLSDSLNRVGTDIRRNATGIKTVSVRVGRLDQRVRSVVTVNAAQNRRINNLDKRAKLDGALEFAESWNGSTVDLFAVFKGAVKSGMLDSTKGVFASPAAIGGIALLLNILRNNPQGLGAIFAPQGGNT